MLAAALFFFMKNVHLAKFILCNWVPTWEM